MYSYILPNRKTTQSGLDETAAEERMFAKATQCTQKMLRGRSPGGCKQKMSHNTNFERT